VKNLWHHKEWRVIRLVRRLVWSFSFDMRVKRPKKRDVREYRRYRRLSMRTHLEFW
jgi:hypothetical protein